MKGTLLAVFLFVATIALVAIGTIWPVPSAAAYAGGMGFPETPTTPEAAATDLGNQIRAQEWEKQAYQSFANKAQFSSQQDFVSDVKGKFQSLRSDPTLNHFEVFALHSDTDRAQVSHKLTKTILVDCGRDIRDDSRNLHMMKNGDRWEPEWPIEKQAPVPPQVIPVNYFLRWDVIYRGAGDDWGTQDVRCAACAHYRHASGGTRRMAWLSWARS